MRLGWGMNSHPDFQYVQTSVFFILRCVQQGNSTTLVTNRAGTRTQVPIHDLGFA